MQTIYIVRDDGTKLDGLISLLGPLRRSRYEAAYSDSSKRQILISAILHFWISKVQFGYLPELDARSVNKMVLKDKFHSNSHSGKMYTEIISDEGPISIDLEELVPRNDQTIKMYLKKHGIKNYTLENFYKAWIMFELGFKLGDDILSDSVLLIQQFDNANYMIGVARGMERNITH